MGIICSSCSPKHLGVLLIGFLLKASVWMLEQIIFKTLQSLVPGLCLGPRCLRDLLGKKKSLKLFHPGNNYVPYFFFPV